MPSPIAIRPMPRPISSQARSGRQPESAKLATTRLSSSRSASGYERFTATVIWSPTVASTIGWKASAPAHAATADAAMAPSSHWLERKRMRVPSSSTRAT